MACDSRDFIITGELADRHWRHWGNVVGIADVMMGVCERAVGMAEGMAAGAAVGMTDDWPSISDAVSWKRRGGLEIALEGVWEPGPVGRKRGGVPR